MNHPSFTALRRRVDEAITWHETGKALACIREGLDLARAMKCSGELMYFRAQEAIVAERFDEAMGLLKQALMFNPKDGAAYNDMALCMVETGIIEGVLEIFEKGIAAEGDYATIHHNKGWFLNKIGRSTEALACFERALALEPGRVITWENMADAYETLGRISEALEAYRKALSFLKEPFGFIARQIRGEIERLEAGKE